MNARQKDIVARLLDQLRKLAEADQDDHRVAMIDAVAEITSAAPPEFDVLPRDRSFAQGTTVFTDGHENQLEMLWCAPGPVVAALARAVPAEQNIEVTSIELGPDQLRELGAQCLAEARKYEADS